MRMHWLPGSWSNIAMTAFVRRPLIPITRIEGPEAARGFVRAMLLPSCQVEGRMAKLQLSLVCMGLAAAGCSQTGIDIHNAGNQDATSVAEPDTRRPGDDAKDEAVPAQADSLPDLSAPDLFVLPDTPANLPEVRADAPSDSIFVPPEVGPDLVPWEAARETENRDSHVGADESVSRDVLLRDLGGDGVRPDSVWLDGGSDGVSEAGQEVLPLPIDGALATFCSGDVPHMIANGTESYPAVTGSIIPYDCCDGGKFQVKTNDSVLSPIVVSWRRTSFTYPVSVDLANLPSDWSVRVVAGCDPIMSSCSAPGDDYGTGLKGVLTLERATSGIDMSLCLHVEEPTAGSHLLLHSLDLYAPHIPTSH